MSGRAMLMSTGKILAEVAKCDIVCVNCHRVRSRAQHRRRIERVGTSPRLDAKRANWRRQAAMLDVLRDRPCADCGGRFPPCSMDFDHRIPPIKLSRVPALIGRAGDGRILAEVAKCDIVCANCHRARTFARREGTTRRE
jgi:formate-dependent nitrite reductase cytochrome c552 subunit